MGNRSRSGFFRVIHKIALCIEIGVLPDDLDRILIGPHGTIRAQSEEQSLPPFTFIQFKSGIVFQAGECDVIIDTNSKPIFGSFLFQFIKYGLYHRRCELLGRKSIATAGDIG